MISMNDLSGGYVYAESTHESQPLKRSRTLTYNPVISYDPLADDAETRGYKPAFTLASQARRRMTFYAPPEYLNSTATEKAVKHDKAEVPKYLWDARVSFLLGIERPGFFHQRAFDLLRETMLC
ncbi:hypothetical protein ACA910_010106 [Epithemia clementina (nom. ined.)]